MREGAVLSMDPEIFLVAMADLPTVIFTSTEKGVDR
jgi:hypothetical protein